MKSGRGAGWTWPRGMGKKGQEEIGNRRGWDGKGRGEGVKGRGLRGNGHGKKEVEEEGERGIIGGGNGE